jgi:hypothetical protein
VNLNPKVAAALVVALVAAAANVVVILADAYPDNVAVKCAAVVVSTLAPIVAAYAKPQGDWQAKP